MAYITYYGAYFGYNDENVNITGDYEGVYEAQFAWFSMGNFGVWSLMPSSDGVELDFDDDDDGYLDSHEDTLCVGARGA